MPGPAAEGTAGPTVRFAGLTWAVKVADPPVGPGPNRFSPDAVVVDGAGLRLEVRQDDRGWVCAEVAALGRFGHGTYTWEVAADVRALDPSTVLGLFTWADPSEHHHRELDVELGRWGDPDAVADGLHVVQPGGPGREHRFTTARSGRGRHAISWSPGRVELSSAVGDQVHSWTLSGPAVPPAGGGVAPRMNLWQFRGRAPRRPQAVTVTNFRYRPWS